jgi:hypothetical protein
MSPDENKPMAQAVKKLYFRPYYGNYDVLAYKRIWKITGYVVDLSTTFDADVQTFIRSNKETIIKHSNVSKDKSFIKSK